MITIKDFFKYISYWLAGVRYIDGLVQDCNNSSASAMELLQSSAKRYISALISVMIKKKFCEVIYENSVIIMMLALNMVKLKTKTSLDW